METPIPLATGTAARRPGCERRRAKPRSTAADRLERDRSGRSKRAVERTRRDRARVVDANLARAGRRACRGDGSGDQEERRAAVASGLPASRAAGGMAAVAIACGCGGMRVCGPRIVRAGRVGVRVRCDCHLAVAVVTRCGAGHGDARERGLEHERHQEREQQQMPHRFHGGDYRRARSALVPSRGACFRYCPAPRRRPDSRWVGLRSYGFRATRSISADMPPCAVPSRISASYSSSTSIFQPVKRASSHARVYMCSRRGGPPVL